MNNGAPASIEDHKEKNIPFFEVVNAEKLWWALMHSKGILHTDVQDLYRKARVNYEKIILNDYENVELQEVEYCLWKLHYKHIDEFRKRIRPTSSNATNLQNSIDVHTEGFKSFLYEATEFYKDLIIKTRKWYKNNDGSDSKLHRFQYVHHRFLICLGDLARYRELCKKTELENRNWAIATNYYLEAAMVCPDSGNPQNQLALLATYVGDDFLALYHCVRSLAVKEPFPDACDNLMLLFEKNRSSHLPSLSSEALFDFSKPYERTCSSAELYKRNDSSNNAKTGSNEKVDLWSPFVRMISFFFVKSGLEDFPFTFTSTMRELESLVALDDIKLQASLESYEQMDYARKGPCRALQVVSILIFIVHRLAQNPESNDQKEKDELALTTTFIIMGRILERCNWPDSCHLLASVLVFIEWLVGVLDKLETYSIDKRVNRSISYFFGAFVDLLNRVDCKHGEVNNNNNNALWEDYELRGFMPVVQEINLFDFSTKLGSLENYDSENCTRVHRLFLAAINIVEKSQEWISYDKSRKKFYAEETRKTEDESECICGSDKEHENEKSQSQGQSFVKDEQIAVEEEEVILFRPITRYNSAPIHADEMCGEDSMKKSPPSEESLRRASSLFDPQNWVQPNKPPEPAAYPPAGPPSLSAWVVNRESLKSIGKGTSDVTKHELTRIEEIDSLIGSTHISGPTHDSPPYIAPVPSAPFLPDDAVWFKGNSPTFPEKIKEADGILGPSPLSVYPHWSANPGPLDHSLDLPGLFNGYPPFLGMSSSEWLYNYQNSHNLERGGGNQVWPVHGNFDGHLMVSSQPVNMEGPQPQLYTGPGQINGVGYQRPSPYGCGAGKELRAEQQPLLQYLKEREWQLQMEAQLRGPHYMGN